MEGKREGKKEGGGEIAEWFKAVDCKSINN